MRSKNSFSWKWIAGLVIGTLLLVIAARVVYNAARDLVVSWWVPGYSDTNNFEPLSPQAQLSTLESSISNLGNQGINAQQPIQSGNVPAALAWDGRSRLNVLLMGLDSRSWEDGLPRTDTLMLFTLDPETQTAGILSIPRDLWVDIPEYGYDKINVAYQVGVYEERPGGGPGLTIATVERLLNIDINYYAEVDFEAFIRFIDEIGGIRIEVPEEIVVDPLGPGNTMVLGPGPHTLDGASALAYARARNTASGDFDRARRQQQVVMAIREQLLTIEALTALITKAPTLYGELASGIQTNLSLKQIIEIALAAQKIPAENIKRAAINEEYVSNGFTPDGIFILIPDPEKMRELRLSLFVPAEPVTTSITANQPTLELVQAENARVLVLNGTGVPGLAAMTRDKLLAAGIAEAETGNANGAYEFTSIVDYTGNPYTLKYLIEFMHIDPGHIFHSYNPESEYDLEINLGNDWAKAQGLLP